MDRKTRRVRWFRGAVWLGIVLNLAFAIPALIGPTEFLSVLGLNAYQHSTVWLQNAGLLLVLLCLFYALAARDPVGAPSLARRTVIARFLAAAFWLWLLLGFGLAPVFWWIFGIDLALGLIQGYLLMRALADNPQPPRRPWRRSLFSRAYSWFFRQVNRVIVWHRLPTAFMQARNQAALRGDLTEHNLYDTPEPDGQFPPWDPSYRETRAPEGTFNDLAEPRMGSLEARFGRNMPPEECWPEDPAKMLDPSPREVSRRLLARDQFKPATTLNLLAAAWIQFQNHEWFNHVLAGKLNGATANGSNGGMNSDDFIEIPLANDDDWPVPDGQKRTMRVRRTASDPSRPAGASYAPTFRSGESQWWDGSQVYGSSHAIQEQLRSGNNGKLLLEKVSLGGTETEWLPEDPANPGKDLTGFNDNWWVGLSLLHTLFAKEHNWQCDQLKNKYPGRDDEWLFQKARLINAALMAKIHTVEWTPGILNRKVIHIGLNANWWGILGRWFKVRFGRVSDGVLLSGIVGGSTEHHAAPHSLLTEEFVAVYRLHPLIPDEVTFQSLRDGTAAKRGFHDIRGDKTRPAMHELKLRMEDLYYTFGVEHPGQIRLRNYPNSLRNFFRDTPHHRGEQIDIATLDVFRDRERGVPRYNRFRELLRMPRVKTFEDLVGHDVARDDPDLVRTLRDLYRNDIDRVDLLVGLLAEPVPQGFGFSDTAFRIFILMASRRLHSDRFFTVDFRPEIYTQFGMDYLNHTTMTDVLLRHHPELKGPLDGVKNPFAPWKKRS